MSSVTSEWEKMWWLPRLRTCLNPNASTRSTKSANRTFWSEPPLKRRSNRLRRKGLGLFLREVVRREVAGGHAQLYAGTGDAAGGGGVHGALQRAGEGVAGGGGGDEGGG